MTEENIPGIADILEAQRAHFLDGKTLPIDTRIEQLKLLRSMLQNNENAIADALKRDFGKSYFESLSNEISLVYVEITLAVKKIRRWSRPSRPSPSIINVPARCRVYWQPYGNALCISPWNYPVQLALIPVVNALAAGNTVILKPSNVSEQTSTLLTQLINSVFSPEILFSYYGGVQETNELLALKFNKIFFTGSSEVGRIVMGAASKHLTPVTLELGGKNPVIVLPDCNIKRTAQRLVWGKFHNGGQACVSPDHIYVHKDIEEELLMEVKHQIDRTFNLDAENSEALPRIIDKRHFHRLTGLIKEEKIFHGGKSDEEKLFIEPTILRGVSEEDSIMKEEIFGPLMPFIVFEDIDDLLDLQRSKPSPLAFYIFTGNLSLARKIHSEMRTGGGMINDTVVHFINASTPFGGIGESGMGSYHGKAGFDTFSHKKSVITKPTWFELWAKYPPYTSFKTIVVRLLLR